MGLLLLALAHWSDSGLLRFIPLNWPSHGVR